MTIQVDTFRPAGASVQYFGTAGAQAGVQIYTGTNGTGGQGFAPNYGVVRIANLGTSVAFVAFGYGTGVTVTSTTGLAIPVTTPGGVGEKFGFADYSHLTAITASGTSTLNVTYGGGL